MMGYLGKSWVVALVMIVTGCFILVSVPSVMGAVEKGIKGVRKPLPQKARGVEKERLLGRNKIIALFGDQRDAVPSQNFVAGGPTWYGLLKAPLEQGAGIIASHQPRSGVVTIDEFGFDYDGNVDSRTADLLRLAKQMNPEMKIGVWQMRGPVAPKLADAYRDVVDIVLMETYVGCNDLWAIGMQLKAAELNGLGDRSIVGLGAGRCARDHVNWATTKEEMEEQMRFVRLIAPDSPGVGFFAVGGNMETQPITLSGIDEICSRWDQLPTDGRGLRPELFELAEIFTKPHKAPTLILSPAFAYPNFTVGQAGANGEWEGFGNPVEPHEFRMPVLNIGNADAKGVIIRVRGENGKFFAQGIVDLPARSVTAAVMPAFEQFTGWGGKSWRLEVVAPGCNVLNCNLEWNLKDGENNIEWFQQPGSKPTSGH